jgi:murein DD-endopeptidase MepM/ murein hydrolase activator NlpD
MAQLRQRAIGVGAILLVALGSVVVAAPADAGRTPQEELGALRSSDAELEDRLEQLARWVRDGRSQLDHLDGEIVAAEQAVVKAEAAVARARQRVERQTLEVQERAVAAYVHPTGLAGASLSTELNEAAEQSLLVRQVAEHDREILQDKADAEAAMKADERSVEADRDHLERTRAEVTDLLDELFAQRDEAEEAQAALDARIAAVQAEVDAIAAAQTGLADLINQLSGTGGDGVSRLVIPVAGTLTSRFGPRWGRLHGGIDIAASTGTPIRAAAAGTTIYSAWMSGYGNVVIVDHGGGMSTLYAHQSRRRTTVGDRLNRGEVLGEVGSTGHSTGAHLHFEVRERGVAVDPLPYLSS